MSPRESIEFLITEVAEHDSHGAFRALFHIFFDQVMRFVGMQIKDKHDAEEVAADVFSALWQGRKRLTGVKKLDGYIYSVAWHKIADYRQSQQKKPFTTDDFSLYEGTTTTLKPR
jgi:DNA-directed RNA polymerase specialized sigma24 family protein